MRPTFSRAAISFSADATSSACVRLSSWQGPAMIEIGSSLPNLTEPAATTGEAEIVAFNVLSFSGRTMPGGDRSINPFGLEYQGCAKGHVRRHDDPLDMASRH